MKKRHIITLSLLLGFSLAGCGNEGQVADKEYIGDYEGNNDVVIESNLKIVYTANYTIESEDINKCKKDIGDKSNELGGYTSAINQYDTKAIIVYNIPTAKLNGFLDYIDSFEGVGNKVVSSTDITSDYSYTQARIQTLEASRIAYTNLLASATDIYNIIAINEKIEDIDTELADLSIKKAIYDNQLDYSKVTINYYLTNTYKEPTFFDEYFEYLGDFFVGLGKFILYSLPVLAIMFGVFSAIFFPIRAKLRKRKANQ